MRDTNPVRAVNGPHRGQPVVKRLAAADPQGGLILVHGRYATAEGMLTLVDALGLSAWNVYAPQAAAGTWYPYSFLAPHERNEPHLSSALDFLDATVEAALEDRIAEERIALLGFSQGACLSLEFAARGRRSIGGVIGLSGGLIGPPGMEFSYDGSRDGLQVFLGCSDVDPHIPVERVRETEHALSALGASVDMKIYAGMGHTISPDELKMSRNLLGRIA